MPSDGWRGRDFIEVRYTFPKAMRIRSREEFSRVFEGRVRESRGPLTLYGVPNALERARLGISISRKVGTAPRRNRIKRLLREAFRQRQHDMPAGYDVVIVVRPHEPLMLAAYQALLTGLMLKLHATWRNRGEAAGPRRMD